MGPLRERLKSFTRDFAEHRALITQMLNDGDYLSPKRIADFSQRKYWVYRSIAAGHVEGDDLSRFIEKEKDPAVVRQLAFNAKATGSQLSLLAELWVPDEHVISSRSELRDVAYAIANHDNCPAELKSRIAPNWKL